VNDDNDRRQTMRWNSSAAFCLAAALLGHAASASADPVPAGTLITGTATGAASGLLGLDSGFADVPGSGVTALAASDLEYLSNDFAVAIDFLTDGSVTFYDNTGFGLLAGSYTFSFELAGLPGPLFAFELGDLSGITGGSITTQVLDAQRIRITLTDVAFADAFGSFGAQLTVPEPTTPALVLAGLALLWGARRPSTQRLEA
jgi:hypothetical protein